jgi:hypothetical protein
MSERIMSERIMTGEDLIQQFEEGTTRPDTFHHADHVRLAFEYLSRYSVLEALQRFADALRRFAAAQGKAERYHQTITWAYLLLIHERIARASGGQECRVQTWEEFAAHNPDLFLWKGGVLNTLYRQETLDSDLARHTFVFPDRSTSQGL